MAGPRPSRAWALARPLAWLCWAWPLGALPMIAGGVGLAWAQGGLPAREWWPNNWPQRLGALALLWACLAWCVHAPNWLWLGAAAPAACLVLGLAAMGWRAGRGASEAQGRLWLRALAFSGAAVGLVALALWGALQGAWLPQPWAAWLSGGTGDRPAFPFGHPNQLAAALVLALAAAGALALRGGRWPWLVAVLLAALVATGSRAGLLGAALALGAVGARQALAWRAEAHRAGAKAGGLGGQALGAATALALGAGALALNPWWAARWLALLPGHPSFDQARVAAWDQAWRLVALRPWAGWGPDAWARAPQVLAQPLPHPHQAYLHLALVVGLPGALLGAGLAWGAVLRAWRLGPCGAWPAWALASGLGACFAMGLVDEAVLELRLLALAIALGACLWAWPAEAP